MRIAVPDFVLSTMFPLIAAIELRIFKEEAQDVEIVLNRSLNAENLYATVPLIVPPLTEGQGPAGAYLRRISEDHRAAMRERLRQNLFGNRADGPFTLQAKAWAVRGIVP